MRYILPQRTVCPPPPPRTIVVFGVGLQLMIADGFIWGYGLEIISDPDTTRLGRVCTSYALFLIEVSILLGTGALLPGALVAEARSNVFKWCMANYHEVAWWGLVGFGAGYIGDVLFSGDNAVSVAMRSMEPENAWEQMALISARVWVVIMVYVVYACLAYFVYWILALVYRRCRVVGHRELMRFVASRVPPATKPRTLFLLSVI